MKNQRIVAPGPDKQDTCVNEMIFYRESEENISNALKKETV